MHCNEGLKAIHRCILHDHSPNARIYLFTSPTTIAAGTAWASIVEPSFSGYALKLASGITWPAAIINGSGEAETDGPTLTWTCTAAPGSPETVYGVAVTIEDDTGTERLWFADLLPTPQIITNIGDEIKVKLNWFAMNY